jgi:hypothetical protein
VAPGASEFALTESGFESESEAAAAAVPRPPAAGGRARRRRRPVRPSHWRLTADATRHKLARAGGPRREGRRLRVGLGGSAAPPPAPRPLRRLHHLQTSHCRPQPTAGMAFGRQRLFSADLDRLVSTRIDSYRFGSTLIDSDRLGSTRIDSDRL